MTGSNDGRPAPAVEVLGIDYVFPHRIEGLPARLSDVEGLRIGSFTTGDGVRLRYWEAGSGRPLIFVPGWSANGAEYVNVIHLLSDRYRVIVLDQRNQGLSDTAAYGNRIARYAMDLRELVQHLSIGTADYCGWSMGASVLWSVIDQWGAEGFRKAVFVDEPISIAARPDWSDRQRREAGAQADTPDALIAALQAPLPKVIDPETTSFAQRATLRDAPSFANSEAFAEAVIRKNPAAMMQVLYDHAANDWRDVVRHKITMPAAFFTGDYSENVPSQRWAHSVVPGSRLYVYGKAEQGDHFLMFKNPIKFTRDLHAFLES